MKQFEEIVERVIKETKENAGPDDESMLNPLCRYSESVGMRKLLEALKPELELMLKEQAQMVKEAACGVIRDSLFSGKDRDGIETKMMDAKHPWVNLDEGAG